MIIHRCDKCGKTAEQEIGKTPMLPNKWFKLVYSIGYGVGSVTYEICPDCRVALKIPVTATEADVGKRLIELIGEIVHEEMDN